MELKANELRLNNLLYYKNELKEICSIHSDNTIRFKDDEKVSIGCFKVGYDLIKPIPLTEEWLLKFGFEKKESIWFLNEIQITSWFTFRFSLEPLKAQEIDYVHQLQNLYFALTNKELEIKM